MAFVFAVILCIIFISEKLFIVASPYNEMIIFEGNKKRCNLKWLDTKSFHVVYTSEVVKV